MHKGRQYELELAARVYSCQAGYPQWWAKRYVVEVTGWQGSFSGSMTQTEAEAEYADIDRDAGLFEYRAAFSNTGGRLIEIVMECSLIDMGRDVAVTLQLYADGVAQMQLPALVSFFQKWKQGSRATFMPPMNPGAILGYLGVVSCVAEPY